MLEITKEQRKEQRNKEQGTEGHFDTYASMTEPVGSRRRGSRKSESKCGRKQEEGKMGKRRKEERKKRYVDHFGTNATSSGRASGFKAAGYAGAAERVKAREEERLVHELATHATF